MKTRQDEDKPQAVPERAERNGDIRARWAWVERSVWTERMLHSLERGVQGGKWYCMVDKVYKVDNLRAAWAQVRANKGAAGVDHEAVASFDRKAEENLAKLAEELRTGRYRPSAVRRVHIPKPGRPGETRPLGIPTVRDRVAQTALRNVLEPIFEVGFAEHSYGFRPGRSTKDALRAVRGHLDAGFTHVVDADLKGYFDTISHEVLLSRLRGQVTDGRVLDLVAAFLTAGVKEGEAVEVPVMGTPQGGVISPLLANIYLDPLDHLVAGKGWRMVRYADDFVILCASADEAARALDTVREWTASVALTLHPEKTHIVSLEEPGTSFDFLGYRFTREKHNITPKARERLRQRIRELTRRHRGDSPATIVRDLNRVLKGWFQYFKHASQSTLQEVDAFVRTRLRAIMWKQKKGRGFPGPALNQRWPVATFDKLGVFSLKTARKLEVAARHAGRPLTGEPCA